MAYRFLNYNFDPATEEYLRLSAQCGCHGVEGLDGLFDWMQWILTPAGKVAGTVYNKVSQIFKPGGTGKEQYKPTQEVMQQYPESSTLWGQYSSGVISLEEYIVQLDKLLKGNKKKLPWLAIIGAAVGATAVGYVVYRKTRSKR